MTKSSNQTSTFDVLIQVIATTQDNVKRDKFIFENSSKVALLLKWLARTVSKLSFAVPDLALNEQDETLSLMWNCILLISSVSTINQQHCETLCQAIQEEPIFFQYLNRLVSENCSNEHHLGVLVNFSRHLSIVDQIVYQNSSHLSDFLNKLVRQLQIENRDDTDKLANKKFLLSAYLNNLSQSNSVRRSLIEQNQLVPLMCVFERFENRTSIRQSIVSIIRNCCFSEDLHHLILFESPLDNASEKDGIELLVKLVLPLAGPEDFSDDENDKLPLDLQYLPGDKTREPCPEIRILLVESIHLLCSTRHGREMIRSANVYYILREYHKWETDSFASESLLNLIDVLIKTEDELYGIDNLKNLTIPQDLVEKFSKLNSKDDQNQEPVDQTTQLNPN